MNEVLSKSDNDDNEVKIIQHKILHLVIRVTQIAMMFLTFVCVVFVVWKFLLFLEFIRRMDEENGSILDKVSIIQHESTELNIMLRKELDVQNQLIEKIAMLNKVFNEKKGNSVISNM